MPYFHCIFSIITDAYIYSPNCYVLLLSIETKFNEINAISVTNYYNNESIYIYISQLPSGFSYISIFRGLSAWTAYPKLTEYYNK